MAQNREFNPIYLVSTENRGDVSSDKKPLEKCMGLLERAVERSSFCTNGRDVLVLYSGSTVHVMPRAADETLEVTLKSDAQVSYLGATTGQVSFNLAGTNPLDTTRDGVRYSIHFARDEKILSGK